AVFVADLPAAQLDEPEKKEAAPRPAKTRAKPDADDEAIERRRSPRRGAESRRRDRYDEDDEDDRPRRSIKKGKSSSLGIVLIVGGVLGSVLIVIAIALAAMWYLTAPVKTEFAGGFPVAQGPVKNFGGDDDVVDDDQADNNKKEPVQNANAKEPEPPP